MKPVRSLFFILIGLVVAWDGPTYSATLPCKEISVAVKTTNTIGDTGGKIDFVFKDSGRFLIYLAKVGGDKKVKEYANVKEIKDLSRGSYDVIITSNDAGFCQKYQRIVIN